MSCDCAQCRQHYRTLGIAYGIPSESEVEEAYHESVKQWHPDLYENYASLRADAEEHFKQIQVAYRELKEHNGGGGGGRSSCGDMPVQSAQYAASVLSSSGGDAGPALVWRRARLPCCPQFTAGS
jgi:hypothetical protein